MAKQLTRKQQESFERKLISKATDWKNGGKFSPEQLAEKIWHVYGYQTQAVNGKVEIWARHSAIATL